MKRVVAHMVEVGNKEDTKRVAKAYGRIKMKRETIQLIKDGLIKKRRCIIRSSNRRYYGF